mmetsp:Transcript_122317/g.341256  ORF Transcript_122317/g.341256 Transcript_122317/m.341256 type:complete len:289 (+) Transcript_122317:766-1632(+)
MRDAAVTGERAVAVQRRRDRAVRPGGPLQRELTARNQRRVEVVVVGPLAGGIELLVQVQRIDAVGPGRSRLGAGRQRLVLHVETRAVIAGATAIGQQGRVLRRCARCQGHQQIAGRAGQQRRAGRGLQRERRRQHHLADMADAIAAEADAGTRLRAAHREAGGVVETLAVRVDHAGVGTAVCGSVQAFVAVDQHRREHIGRPAQVAADRDGGTGVDLLGAEAQADLVDPQRGGLRAGAQGADQRVGEGVAGVFGGATAAACERGKGDQCGAGKAGLSRVNHHAVFQMG